MERIWLFLFLVVVVPMGIYWSTHDFEAPLDNIGRFIDEVTALRGARPEPVTPVEDPEPEPESADEEDPQPEEEPDPPPVDPEKEDRHARAERLFGEGNFRGAATAYAGIDDDGHSLAQLGIAFGDAFPETVADLPYVHVKTSAGAEFEGFAEKRGGLLKLTALSGRTLSLPQDALAGRREIPLDRVAERIRTEASGDVEGKRLFVLVQEAFTLGRRDIAAPLLSRLLEEDARAPFFLKAVRERAPEASRPALFRSFAACMREPEEEKTPVETLGRSPEKLGNGQPMKRVGGRRDSSTIRDGKAIELVRKAAPIRQEGEQLYKETYQAGLDGAKLETIDRAIELLDEAAGLYEKALEHEDSDEIHALLVKCSRLNFKLRFWREQVGAR